MFAIIVFACAALTVSEACLCSPQTTEERIDAHDFAINATITSAPQEVELDDGPHRKYSVKVDHVIKRPTFAIDELYLRSGKTSCSIDELPIGATGMFIGNFDLSEKVNIVDFCGAYINYPLRRHHVNTDIEIILDRDHFPDDEFELLKELEREELGHERQRPDLQHKMDKLDRLLLKEEFDLEGSGNSNEIFVREHDQDVIEREFTPVGAAPEPNLIKTEFSYSAGNSRAYHSIIFIAVTAVINAAIP